MVWPPVRRLSAQLTIDDTDDTESHTLLFFDNKRVPHTRFLIDMEWLSRLPFYGRSISSFAVELLAYRMFRRLAKLLGWGLQLGLLLFCGSLYVMTLTGMRVL